jgi:hypothetical protein
VVKRAEFLSGQLKIGQKEISEISIFCFFVLSLSLVKTSQLIQVLKIYGTCFSHGLKKENIFENVSECKC